MTERLLLFKELCGRELIDKLDAWRRKKKEIQRNRQLGTVEMLWLFLCVAAYSRAGSLAEIIRLNLQDCGTDLRLTEAAFCKARMRFSPQSIISPMG